MHVPKDLMLRVILKTFWFSRCTKQGPDLNKEPAHEQDEIARL
jgi:hypothetical protein